MGRTDTIVDSGRQAALQEKFIRFCVSQRLEHFLIMTCFIALLLTGLPQKFDEASFSVWIVNNLGGIDRVRFLHRVFACVFMFGSFYHLAVLGVSMARGRFRPTMMPTLRDFFDALNMLRYSVGLSSSKPLFGRYDYRQKFEYWGIVLGAVIMIISGLILWFPTYATRALPGEMIPASKEMHSGEALLAMLVIVVWHLYSVMLSPAHFPGDFSVFTGKISRKTMLEEHPLECPELLGLDLSLAERELTGDDHEKAVTLGQSQGAAGGEEE